MTYELFEQGPAAYLPVLLLSLVITLAIYSVFPLILAVMREYYITAKRYRKLCYGVNFLIHLAFSLFCGSVSFWPYILWTGVFSSLGIRVLKRNGTLDESSDSPRVVTRDPVEEQPKATRIEGSATAEKAAPAPPIRYCRQCGFKLIAGSAFCSQCGTKVSYN